MIQIVKLVKKINMEDFAFIYYFGDNDFGSNFERAGELYCDEFNRILEYINDSVNKLQKEYNIKNLEELKKKENIINLLKFGFSSYYFEDKLYRTYYDIPTYEEASKKLAWLIDDYFLWDEDKPIFSKNSETGEYDVTDLIPRLFIGTLDQIKETLPKFGICWDNDTRLFPVDCNGEALIIYTSDGKLDWTIR
jgi:hypothetical protein